jgi:hypothetical protein
MRERECEVRHTRRRNPKNKTRPARLDGAMSVGGAPEFTPQERSPSHAGQSLEVSF